jgi:hypothetical protein
MVDAPRSERPEPMSARFAISAPPKGPHFPAWLTAAETQDVASDLSGEHLATVKGVMMA